MCPSSSTSSALAPYQHSQRDTSKSTLKAETSAFRIGICRTNSFSSIKRQQKWLEREKESLVEVKERYSAFGMHGSALDIDQTRPSLQFVIVNVQYQLEANCQKEGEQSSEEQRKN